MSKEKVLEFMGTIPPSWQFMKTKGANGKVHVVMTSDHKLVMQLYRRQKGDALCKRAGQFPELFPTDDPKDGRLCPKCVTIAERLVTANKATEGSVIRYLEERFE